MVLLWLLVLGKFHMMRQCRMGAACWNLEGMSFLWHQPKTVSESQKLLE